MKSPSPRAPGREELVVRPRNGSKSAGSSSGGMTPLLRIRITISCSPPAKLVDGSTDELPDIEMLARTPEAEPTREPGAGQIEELLDHLGHAMTRRRHPAQSAQLGFVDDLLPEHLRAHHQRSERVAQFVSEDAD